MADRSPVGDRIPIVVLGGWLGSGKTTLLNRLLTVGAAGRLAIVVNDVGDINIDAALIERHDGETVELTDGCICCSIGDSLAVTLRDIVVQDNPPDGIVIEASGIADPEKVAAYGDRRRVHGDLIAVTVDATAVRRQADHPTYGKLVHRQVEAADVLLLTKTDLGSGNAATAWCRQIAPTTRIIDGQHQPDLALAAITPSTQASRSVAVTSSARAATWVEEHTATGSAGSAAASSAGFEGFATVTWDPTDSSLLADDDLQAILAEAIASDLIRAKGVIAGPDGPRLIHVAGHRISIEATSIAPTGIVTIWARPEPPAGFDHRRNR